MIDGKAFWKRRKKTILWVTAGVAAVAIGCSVWYTLGHSSKEPVYVFPFEYVGMTEYWGDSQESYGPVTTDRIQTVFLSDTQTVTEILVEAGDAVKKGDLLMTFDTTLSDLQLERKRLDVEKKKLQLEDAREELRRINAMKPMVIPSVQPTPADPDLGESVTQNIYPKLESIDSLTYDGSSPQKALICWIPSGADITDTLLEEIRQRAERIQETNTPPSPPVTEPSLPEETEPAPTESPDPTETTETQPAESTPAESEPAQTEALQEMAAAGNGAYFFQFLSDSVEEPDVPAVDLTINTFYVVFKSTSGNMTLAERTLWQCLKVTRSPGVGYSFQFADTLIPDYSLPDNAQDSTADTPQIDLGSGYTAAQIAQMRSDQQKNIKELEFGIKMAEAEYKIMQTEANDGNVYAEIDGEVVSLLTEEEAKQSEQPILKVSGGGGFYMEGFVSELEKDKLRIGQEVTVNDWNTGMTYTGTIESMGDFPSREGYYNGMGNPNASYYPFKVFVDGTADLQAGSYVSVMYSAAESEHGIYLENPFLRTEGGQSYVYILDDAGKLEKRYVTTGKSLWGSYTEILSGLTAEDLIAFPYGKNIKPGAAAEEGDLSSLYG